MMLKKLKMPNSESQSLKKIQRFIQEIRECTFKYIEFVNTIILTWFEPNLWCVNCKRHSSSHFI